MKPGTQFCAITLALAVAAGTAARAAAPQDANVDPRIWLVPCAAWTWDREEQWRDSLHRVLRLDSEPAGAHLVASIVTRPAFAPEWSIRIFRHNEIRCELRFARSRYNLARALNGECDERPCPKRIGARFAAVPVSCATVDAVRDAVSLLLERLRPPQPDDPVFTDGESYEVTLAGAEGAASCGYTHEPPLGSPAAQFATLVAVLREIAESKGEQRDRIEGVARSLAGGLVQSPMR